MRAIACENKALWVAKDATVIATSSEIARILLVMQEPTI
jgi:hypothetical protein